MAIAYPAGLYMREVVLQENTLTVAYSLRHPGEVFGRLSSYLSRENPTEYFLEGLGSTSARLDYIGGVSTIVRDTPGRVPFQYGRTLVLFPTAFVPRIFWPSKPEITIGQWVTDNYGSGPLIESNTGPSVIGDLFLNFGTVGVLVGMLLFGAFFRLAHELLLRGRPTVPGIFLTVVVFREATLNFGANLASAYAATIMSATSILVVHFIVRSVFGSRPHLPALARE